MVYQWRSGARWKGRAQDIGERLEMIRSETGVLTPSAVVEDAKDPASPLHPCIEWDDTRAAQAYRIDTARQIIADVMVVYAEEIDGAPAEPVRAFASVSPTPTASAYASTLDAMRSPAMRQTVLAQAKRELDGWRRRYRHYQELASAVQRVDAALAEMAITEQVA